VGVGAKKGWEHTGADEEDPGQIDGDVHAIISALTNFGKLDRETY
jgi:hypothetical protein